MFCTYIPITSFFFRCLLPGSHKCIIWVLYSWHWYWHWHSFHGANTKVERIIYIMAEAKTIQPSIKVMVKVIALAGQILHYVTIIIIIQHCIFRYYYYYCCDYSQPELSHYVLHKAEVHSQPHITYSHVQSWSSSSARENQANNQHHLQPHTWLYIYM